MSEEKKNVNIWKSLQKVPAGTMFVPLIIGAIITTIGQGIFNVDIWATLGNPMKDMFSSSGQMLIIGLMLFFTGFSRFSSDIAKNQVKATKDKTAELLEMKALVDDVQKLLVSKADLKEFGKLLDYTWKLKRGITSDISNNDIDILYKKAIDAGATGGKLLGAGGGGFLLFYVEPEYQENVKKALEDLVYVPFEFENEGTRIMYFRPEYFDLESVKEGS